MKRRVLVIGATVAGTVVAAWLFLNPGGRFGMSRSLFTTYNRVPLPLVDLQVRGDGTMRVVTKTHKIAAEQLAWLAEPEPRFLIIAEGWDGDARVVALPEPLKRVQVLTLRTGEALRMFNSLRARGVKVAIHVHSSC